MSELSGVFGLGLIAVAGALMWIIRLTSNAAVQVSPESDGEDSHEPASQPPEKPGINLILTPAAIVDTQKKTADKDGARSAEAIEALPSSGLGKSPAVKPATPDSESAREQLKIAEQLSFIGDLEGVTEYARLVADDKDASERQRTQAENLIRLARTR